MDKAFGECAPAETSLWSASDSRLWPQGG